MSDTGFEAEFEAYCAAHGAPERIELMLADVNALLRGKWIPGAGAGARLGGGGVKLPISTYALNIHGQEVEETGLGIVVGDPDGAARALPGSLSPCLWLDGRVAQVQIELSEPDGSPSPLDSRRILGRLLDGFAARGLTPVVATELEFHLIEPRKAGHEPPTPPPHTPDAQTLELEICGRYEAILTDIQDAAAAQGLPTDTMIAEYGPGQFEINFLHTDDALKAADYALLFRRLVRGVARAHGLDATFMAKPYADSPGNGMHAHVSVLGPDGANIFAGPGGGVVSAPLGHAVAGLLATMRELQAVFAPHLNSYRRFRPNSFAPTEPVWGVDNRAAAVRLPAVDGASARFEHRICGADVNPYLALAAILGGVLHGLDAKPPLPPALGRPNAEPVRPLAQNWNRAVDAFEISERAAEIFGEEFVRIYCAIRRDEMELIGGAITPEEYRAYLGRI